LACCNARTSPPFLGIFLACLAINRGAYVIAIWLKNMDYLPQQVSDDIPHDGRNDDVHREHNRYQNAHCDPWQEDLGL
jgi:hypothetical protein